MRFAVIQFPGSNCDRDCVHALQVLGQEARLVWHQETRLDSGEGVILPGGFSYGDYLRCGAIARFSPILPAVKAAAERGEVVVGICNGFQILCEAGLLPGALTRNEGLHFRCETAYLRVETPASRFTSHFATGQTLSVPIAHGEGCYRADPEILQELEAEQRVLFRYCNAEGQVVPEANPNGSSHHIAGICNAGRNVLGMMPHPERCCEVEMGGTDGRGILLGAAGIGRKI
ncbi:MAG: phosphoribosylformylglycinamidine synthase subunit PurQ [Verrucomicrobia bacterium]|nr:phosphoribosylformylglycinamidine synthase subunit PurQ [Verrucomicrobiota bacterium]NBS50778.1 phosphoribosylformylglycinamidine synthase subunit PurQ [Verrucomicrobiota bacterium]NBT24572.1 phosphoribosylformylglycinamidine synthase subunit PurQ [bacterium]NBV97710.1 phosphoribosylformylglycinamidine synthase subunit PurQ [Verrucomicrobiota bacterium]NBY66114.1 phosphoribosylformylglycinamidine synthase subunit PurQ [Verrucomicrobiota bacterium]